ncbi:MAG: putative HTH-type transcriptional regulator [Methanonatronarchaeales archaeon]|nr:putative HTH-type transcriptional regulator [Methanonatronarchaeales archaeon]
MAIDEIDKEILKALIEDGRISYRELAGSIGVTPPTVKRRVDEMRGWVS